MYGIVSRLPRLYVHKRNHVETETLVPVRSIDYVFNAGIIPWYITMNNLHLTNNFLGYILPTLVSPFYIILTKTYVESIPRELQDAAEVDGAGTLKVFFSIILPIIKPILATVAILRQ